MTNALIGLSLAYLVLGVLLLNVLIFSRIWVWVKVCAVVLVSCFYLVTYTSFTQLMGWPTLANLPERFMLIGQVVVEPDKEKGTPGAIYLWLDDLHDNRPSQMPRSFSLPYSDELYEKVLYAKERQEQGIMQIGSQSKSDGDDLGLFATLFSIQSNTIEFFDLPDPRLPEK